MRRASSLFLGEVLMRIVSLAKNHEKCRALVNRVKQRFHFIRQERGLKGAFVFSLQKIKNKFARHADPLALAEPAPLTSMIRENVHGYNLIKVRSDYYAIKHGFYFDIQVFQGGGYAPGTFLKAGSIRELEALVNQYRCNNAAPRMGNENFKDLI